MSKVYLDECYNCHESKAAIKHSQRIRDPLYCAIVGPDTEGGYGEVEAEFDRHVFVVTEEQIKADKEAWKEYCEFWEGAWS